MVGHAVAPFVASPTGGCTGRICLAGDELRAYSGARGMAPYWRKHAADLRVSAGRAPKMERFTSTRPAPGGAEVPHRRAEHDKPMPFTSHAQHFEDIALWSAMKHVPIDQIVDSGALEYPTFKLPFDGQ